MIAFHVKPNPSWSQGNSMETNSHDKLIRYFLEVECVVTAGPYQNAVDPANEDELKDLPLHKKASERTRRDFNNLLTKQLVRSRCSFGTQVDNQSFAYQSFSQGPHDVELLAQITGQPATSESGELEIELQIIVPTTFNGIGGMRKYERKVILGDWVFLGGCGNSKTYLSQVARLNEFGKSPSESELFARTEQRQSQSRSAMNPRSDLLAP